MYTLRPDIERMAVDEFNCSCPFKVFKPIKGLYNRYQTREQYMIFARIRTESIELTAVINYNLTSGSPDPVLVRVTTP